jgi:hypothetical protein
MPPTVVTMGLEEECYKRIVSIHGVASKLKRCDNGLKLQYILANRNLLKLFEKILDFS